MSDVVRLSPEYRGLNFARVAIAVGQSQNLRDAYGRAIGAWGPAAPATVHLKGIVEGGTATTSPWAADLATSALSDEFIQFARGKSALEQLIPAMKVVQFSTRFLVEDAAPVVSWVGEGFSKPLTFAGFSTAELTPYKLQSTIVVTKELLRMSSADAAVRRLLVSALAEAQDAVFFSNDSPTPTSPAGILADAVPLASTGNPALDIPALFESFQGELSTAYLIMSPAVAASIGLGNSLVNVGARGGEIGGVPVICTKHIAADSTGSAVALIDAAQILFAAGPVEITSAGHASIQMLDNPTGNSSTGTSTSLVSLFQADSAALRVERYLSWAPCRDSAVSWIESVNYAST